MILADTSVWAQFFRGRLPTLSGELEQNRIMMHPVVIGELALGNLPQRAATLLLLRSMPQARVAAFGECMHLLESRRLFGRGIGWSDLQLLASAQLSDAAIWTLDKPLQAVARICAVALHQNEG